MNLFRSWAAASEPIVFAALGNGARDRVEDIACGSQIRLADNPRQASVLLVAGELRDADRDALRQIHDMLPHPRGCIWWSDRPVGGTVIAHEVIATSADPSGAIAELQRGLFSGDIASALPLLADEPAAPWRGIGPHGQGGKGMMGGSPYGRPMAMTADDLRDGLALDEIRLRLGPFTNLLPAGLVIDLMLQGDVVQRASIVRPPHPEAAATRGGQMLRSGSLRRIGRLLALLDLRTLAERCLCLAKAQAGDAAGAATADRMKTLVDAINRSAAVHAVPAGLGQIDLDLAEALGLASLDGSGACDVRWRLQRWLAQAAQASDGQAATVGSSEPSLIVDARLPDLLAGLEWQQALLVINSFDAAALDRLCRIADSSFTADGSDSATADQGHGHGLVHRGHQGHP